MTLDDSIQGFRLRVLREAKVAWQCECDVSTL